MTKNSTTPDLQPTLEGKVVRIRPIRGTDFEALFAAASDPEIWRVHPEPDRYKRDVFRNYFDGAIASESAFVFEDKASEKIIGSSRFYGYDATLSEIEIGWTFLARQYWGGSFNREIKELMTTHAFNFVETVVFWVGEDNLRSRRAMEKIGGVLRPGTQTRGEGGAAAHVIYDLRSSASTSVE